MSKVVSENRRRIISAGSAKMMVTFCNGASSISTEEGNRSAFAHGL